MGHTDSDSRSSKNQMSPQKANATTLTELLQQRQSNSQAGPCTHARAAGNRHTSQSVEETNKDRRINAQTQHATTRPPTKETHTRQRSHGNRNNNTTTTNIQCVKKHACMARAASPKFKHGSGDRKRNVVCAQNVCAIGARTWGMTCLHDRLQHALRSTQENNTWRPISHKTVIALIPETVHNKTHASRTQISTHVNVTRTL